MERIVTDAIRDGRTDVRKMNSAGLYAVPFDVVNPYLVKSCAYCGTSMTKCMVCSRCNDIRYCSPQCQLQSWKSIHKMYCKQHSQVSIGKLNWDNLFRPTNTFSQITVTMREHEGLGQLLEAAIGQVLMGQVGRLMVLHATRQDMNSMARIISRRLNKMDPSDNYDIKNSKHQNAAGLLTIAAAMSTMATEAIDESLATSTPLFRCVARHYVSYAPRFASLNIDESSSSPSSTSTLELQIEGREIFDIPLLSATVNLIHLKLMNNKNQQQSELISRCLEVTWDAIEECNVVLANYFNEQQKQQTETEEEENVKNSAAAAAAATTTTTSNELFIRHLVKGVLPNLRMLARNLAYIGACPSANLQSNFLDRVPKVVMYDILCLQQSLPDDYTDSSDSNNNNNTTTKKKKKKKEEIFVVDQEFYQTNIQCWVTTAHNMFEKYNNNPSTTTTSSSQDQDDHNNDDNDDDYGNQMINLGHYVFAVINKLVLLEDKTKK